MDNALSVPGLHLRGRAGLVGGKPSRLILKFALLELCLSIPFWAIVALAHAHVIPDLQMLNATWSLTPMMAAVILVYRESGARGVKDLFKRCFDYRRIKSKAWYLPIFVLYPSIVFVQYAIALLSGQQVPPPHFTLLVPLAFIGFFLGVFGEELGWTAYALDRMQGKWSALAASALVGIMWASFHAPVWAFSGMSLSWVAWQWIYVVASRVLFVWIYNSTGKSLFAMGLLHPGFGVYWYLFPVSANLGIPSFYDPRNLALTALVMTGIVVFLWGPKTLTRYRFARKAAPARWLPAVAILMGLLVAGLSVPIAANYQRDIRLARERILVGSQIAETPRGPIEYAVAGDGPPVLVAHGAGGGYDQGLDFAGALVQSGFRVIAMSRFGYLRTPLPPDASPAAQADAYAALLDALHIPRAAVVGFSAGAPSSMQFALRYPERTGSLVLFVPAAYPARLEQRSKGAMPKQTSVATRFLFDTALKSDFLLWAAFRLAPRTMLQAVLATPPGVVASASVDERARVAQVSDHLFPFSQRRLGVLNDASITPFLPRYELERIAARTLVLGVADDLYRTYDGARYTAEHVRGARFIGYPSGGHILVGHLDEALSETAAFLKGR